MAVQKASRRVHVEKLLSQAGSTYKLVILAARRALELSQGAPRLVDAPANEKPALVALREIAEGKVTLKIRKEGKSKD